MTDKCLTILKNYNTSCRIHCRLCIQKSTEITPQGYSHFWALLWDFHEMSPIQIEYKWIHGHQDVTKQGKKNFRCLPVQFS